MSVKSYFHLGKCCFQPQQVMSYRAWCLHIWAKKTNSLNNCKWLQVGIRLPPYVTFSLNDSKKCFSVFLCFSSLATGFQKKHSASTTGKQVTLYRLQEETTAKRSFLPSLLPSVGFSLPWWVVVSPCALWWLVCHILHHCANYSVDSRQVSVFLGYI